MLAGFDAGDDLAGLAPAGCGIAGLNEAPTFSDFANARRMATSSGQGRPISVKRMLVDGPKM